MPPTTSVILRQPDGTYCGVDIYGDVMPDSVVLATGAVVDRSPENLALPLWQPGQTARVEVGYE